MSTLLYGPTADEVNKISNPSAGTNTWFTDTVSGFGTGLANLIPTIGNFFANQQEYNNQKKLLEQQEQTDINRAIIGSTLRINEASVATGVGTITAQTLLYFLLALVALVGLFFIFKRR